ncbi:MAG: carbon storage regulator [Planctomycetaceae bacterium]
MLVLTRKCQQSVVVEGYGRAAEMVTITVLGIRGGRVKLGFEAANDVLVDRAEVWQQSQFNGRPSSTQSRGTTAKQERLERWEDGGGGTAPPSERPVARQTHSTTGAHHGT